MVKLALSDELREEMGRVGYERVCRYYRVESMREKYSELYGRLYKER